MFYFLDSIYYCCCYFSVFYSKKNLSFCVSLFDSFSFCYVLIFNFCLFAGSFFFCIGKVQQLEFSLQFMC
jgi:hypothetical protein